MLITLKSSINFLTYIIANKAFRDVVMDKACGRRTHVPVVTAHEMDNTKGAATRYDSPARRLPIALYMGQS